MWSASALFGLRCPLLLYWSLVPHAGQCVMPMACARASTCFLNCLCSLVLVLLTAVLLFFLLVLGGGASQRQRDERLHRLTLLSRSLLYSLSSSFFRLPRLSSLFLFLVGVCCVVRAQPCEHARNTTRTLVFVGLLVLRVVCTPSHVLLVASITTWCLLSPPHVVRC
jgi:hypothetical protein|nr:MAG TPA: hypothetical protein [Caudoviricetes sp.]